MAIVIVIVVSVLIIVTRILILVVVIVVIVIMVIISLLIGISALAQQLVDDSPSTCMWNIRKSTVCLSLRCNFVAKHRRTGMGISQGVDSSLM